MKHVTRVAAVEGSVTTVALTGLARRIRGERGDLTRLVERLAAVGGSHESHAVGPTGARCGEAAPRDVEVAVVLDGDVTALHIPVGDQDPS